MPERKGAGNLPAPFRSSCAATYQLLPSQPPLVVPPVVEHERVLVPLAALVIRNVLPDFDLAVTT